MAVSFVLTTTVAGQILASATFGSLSDCMEMRNKVVEGQAGVTAVCVPKDVPIAKRRMGPPPIFLKMFDLMQNVIKQAMETEQRRLEMLENKLEREMLKDEHCVMMDRDCMRDEEWSKEYKQYKQEEG
jgi:hypothetical protein